MYYHQHHKDDANDERNNECHSEEYVTADDTDDFKYFPSSDDVVIGPGKPKIERTGKLGRPRKIYNVLTSMIENGGVIIPQTTQEAMNSSESKYWLNAMNKQFDLLIANKI